MALDLNSIDLTTTFTEASARPSEAALFAEGEIGTIEFLGFNKEHAVEYAAGKDNAIVKNLGNASIVIHETEEGKVQYNLFYKVKVTIGEVVKESRMNIVVRYDKDNDFHAFGNFLKPIAAQLGIDMRRADFQMPITEQMELPIGKTFKAGRPYKEFNKTTGKAEFCKNTTFDADYIAQQMLAYNTFISGKDNNESAVVRRARKGGVLNG